MMKCGTFIENSMINIFLEKSYAKGVGKLKNHTQNVLKKIVQTLQKIKIEYISGSLFLFKVHKNILNLSCWSLAFIILMLFQKKRSGFSLASCLFFSIIFEEKYLSCFILLMDQILWALCLYSLRYWAIYV